ncbi:MAG: TonB-dependent receptor, partial [Verrucomicrobiota bacterium]
QTDWLISVSSTSQEDPDLRFMSKFNRASGFYGFANTVFPTTPPRYFRLLQEDNYNLRLDNTIPVDFWSNLEGSFKTGFYHARSTRTYKDRGISYESRNDYAPWNRDGDPNTFIPSLSQSATVDDFFIRALPENAYEGFQTINAGYWMGEVPVVERLKLIGGIRLEGTQIDVDSVGGSSTVTKSSTNLKQLDLLPAAGLIYTPMTNMNIRLHYSGTIARPTYREIANVETFDFAGGDVLVGNPNLKITSIQNYDIRWEWFPRPGYVLSAGMFYKELMSPIEQAYETLNQDKIIYQNRSEATVYGLELEGRANLEFIHDCFSRFTAGMNFALIESETPLTTTELGFKQTVDPSTPDTRPLFNQSPYILNFDLSYDNSTSGTSATVAYNIAGERLVITNPFGEDIYEQSAASLDFSISQKLGKSQRWKLKFSAKNLLDPSFERTYGAQGTLPYSSYKKGRTYGVSLSYTF